jgi:hypothetical protein
MLQTHMAVEDDFPSLRTLLWKRGGRALYSAIHEHAPVSLLVGAAFPDSAALEAVHTQLLVDEVGNFACHGDRLFGLVGGHYPVGLSGQLAQLAELAEGHGGRIAAELVPVTDEVPLSRLLAARPSEPGRERLWAHFPNAEDATRFVRTLDKPARQADRYVLIEADTVRPRDGYWAQRNGGVATLIGGVRIRLNVTFWRDREDAPSPNAEALTSELQAHIRPFVTPDTRIQLETVWRSASGALDSERPAELLTALVDFARARDLAVHLEAQPCDRLVDTIARLVGDLGSSANR